MAARSVYKLARTVGRVEASSRIWGVLPDGRRVDEVTLSNANGMEVRVVSYGATITSVKVPGRGGAKEEVTLCYSDLDTLRRKSPYYGSTIGRVGNRIAGGCFTLDGKTYGLATNNGPNHLHGGVFGWDKAVWETSLLADDTNATAVFKLTSHDGEEGYPGTVKAVAQYSLTAANEVVMRFSASTDKATPVNMCNHAYWNLSGDLKRNVHDHTLTLDCPTYLPVDSTSIPTGELAPVSGTPFDFTSPHTIGSRIRDVDGGGEPGYDHCYAVADPRPSHDLSRIAVLEEAASGRRMTVYTTTPGVQVYTGNFLSKLAEDAPHTQHGAVCLETQNFPDAINKSGFPSCVLRPGQEYTALTVHVFEW